ncbi:MAG TPA: alpha-amylase family glycosyl hydrolase [Microthrixaceae bacterium]|nr:alpha-amylase family glycosyl hydrolase [Microthrixaceae bacterium]
MTAPEDTPWWRSAVIYQIYPRSFCDSNGDGVGDLEGIRAHLDHLEWLGVDAIWLSPFFRSPMADYGYDVSDYCDVDPLFGDLAAFDRLLADAHERGLRVIIDWVPNHTSDQHPWFVESRSSTDSPRRGWYVWRDPPTDGSLPNNWTESLTMGPAWTLDEATGQYYLHNFLPSQPDLDWHHPAVVEAMHGTLRFWLDRGVDGFRMDVVNLIGKDPALPSEPEDLVGLPHVVLNDRPETHAHLREIRRLLDGYPGDRVSIGEVMLLEIEQIVGHLGDQDELHLAFNFPPMFGPWDAARWRATIARTELAHLAAHAPPTWVLSNHDQPRHRTRFGGDERTARSAAVLLATLRGTVFLYAGEELGLEDAIVEGDDIRDPGGRDGCRAPIPWTPDDTHGWAGDPWLPWPPRPERLNVETLLGEPDSIPHLYRRLLDLRRHHPGLRLGDLDLLDSADGVVAFRRHLPDDPAAATVAVNFTDRPIAFDEPDEPLVLTSSGREPLEGRLDPYEAAVWARS